MKEFELRPYQKSAVEAIIGQWNSGFKRTLLVLPTGTGKTVVFSKVVEEEVKPATPNHLQAPVTSDKDTSDAQKGNDNTTKTGDNNNILLYCLYLLLSATGIVVVYSRRRKNS